AGRGWVCSAPSRQAGCSLGQMTECGRLKGVIRALGLACDDCLVRDGFVGVAGQKSCALILCAAYVEPSPAVVNFAGDDKAKAQIAILDVQPITGVTGRDFTSPASGQLGRLELGLKLLVGLDLDASGKGGSHVRTYLSSPVGRHDLIAARHVNRNASTQAVG